MKVRRLGPLEVSEISFGTWLTIAGNIERAQSDRCIHAAIAHGINFFDTANQYGAGFAEKQLAESLADIPRDKYLLATKLYFPVGDDPDHGLSAKQIEKQLNNSLTRLRTDYIDLYQCHRYDAEIPLDETMAALTRVVEAGKVKAIGFSEWKADQIDAAAALSAASNYTPFTSSQPQYSILWRKPEAAIFPASVRHGIGNIVYSPLAQGALTGKYKPGEPPPTDSRAANDAMNIFMETSGRRFRGAEVLTAVQQLLPVASDLGLTLSQLALSWVLRRPEVSSAIIGASRPEQIESNVKASGVTLDAKVLERIDSLVNGVSVRG